MPTPEQIAALQELQSRRASLPADKVAALDELSTRWGTSSSVGNLSRIPQTGPEIAAKARATLPPEWKAGKVGEPGTVGKVARGGAIGLTEGAGVPQSTDWTDYTVLPGLSKMVRHPIASAKVLAEGVIEPSKERARMAWRLAKERNIPGAAYNTLASIPIVGTAAAGAGEAIRSGYDTGDPEEMARGVGQAVGLIGTLGLGAKGGRKAAGDVYGSVSTPIKASRNARATAKIPAYESAAIKTIKEGLKGGKNVEENIGRARPYLKEVGRSNPKTISDVHAGIDAHRATIGNKLQEQVARHPEIRVFGDDIASAIKNEISAADRVIFPEAVKQIEGEVARYAGKELTAPQALEVAAKLRAMKKSYFNAAPADQLAAENASGSIRAIDTAHDVIVDRLAERLEATGEKGVKEMRADYGALRNLTDAAYKAKVKTGQTPKPTLGGAIYDEATGHTGLFSGLGAIAGVTAGHPVSAVSSLALPPVIGAMRYLKYSGRTSEALTLKGIKRLGKLPGKLPDYSPSSRPTPAQLRQYFEAERRRKLGLLKP